MQHSRKYGCYPFLFSLTQTVVSYLVVFPHCLYNHGNLLLESVFANGSTYMYLHGKGCPSQKAFFVNNPSSVSPLDPVQEIPCCTVWWW